jgi:hypothetical protein
MEYEVTLGDAGNDVEHRGFCEEHRGLSSLQHPAHFPTFPIAVSAMPTLVDGSMCSESRSAFPS